MCKEMETEKSFLTWIAAVKASIESLTASYAAVCKAIESLDTRIENLEKRRTSS